MISRLALCGIQTESKGVSTSALSASIASCHIIHESQEQDEQKFLENHDDFYTIIIYCGLYLDLSRTFH